MRSAERIINEMLTLIRVTVLIIHVNVVNAKKELMIDDCNGRI